MEAWFIGMAQIAPLVTSDTSAGPESYALPDPGSDSTGQTSLNNEILIKKLSADGNALTITGATDGNVVLTVQYAYARFKSDGANWWRVG